jgi:pilus assembly protein Flp/PilA
MKDRTNTQTSASGIWRRFTRDQSGATAIEYALIAGGISLLIVAGVSDVGSTLLDIFTDVAGLF